MKISFFTLKSPFFFYVHISCMFFFDTDTPTRRTYETNGFTWSLLEIQPNRRTSFSLRCVMLRFDGDSRPIYQIMKRGFIGK